MSVAEQARAAAREAFPFDSDWLVAKGMRQVPYAQGYRAGHAAAMAEMIDWLIRRGIRPEIDQPGCCELCRGSGQIAVGPWGVRPPKVRCHECDGSGWGKP